MIGRIGAGQVLSTGPA